MANFVINGNLEREVLLYNLIEIIITAIVITYI